ncbi:MAG: nicotinate (nicotinamide) nucleotide adenylyltransferase [Desulfovibrio sp.]|jgi:nicotinate-nucleotide adenylyltransferase|nr:nicotinate (nicotinamide) nucleotide adenylyltransferase [Desulfovibrio sp.]
MPETSARPGRLVLGGAFNPLHIGHLRFAVEALEALGPLADGVDLTPTAVPPHKDAGNLLPFGLRAAMTEAAVTDMPGLRCNRAEARRRGPSYTWDMLSAARAQAPGTDFYFLLGMSDFVLLPTWFRGEELPRLCHFVVAPRAGMGAKDFTAAVLRLWPTARERPPLVSGGLCAALPGGGLAHFLPLPVLEISASGIRQRWLAGRNISWLVPAPVARLLERSRHIAQTRWSGATRG